VGGDGGDDAPLQSHEPCPHFETPRFDQSSPAEHRHVRCSPADVDVRDGFTRRGGTLCGTRTAAREHGFEGRAGRGGDEIARVHGDPSDEPFRVLTLRGLPGHDHRAGIDVGGGETRGGERVLYYRRNAGDVYRLRVVERRLRDGTPVGDLPVPDLGTRGGVRRRRVGQAKATHDHLRRRRPDVHPDARYPLLRGHSCSRSLARELVVSRPRVQRGP